MVAERAQKGKVFKMTERPGKETRQLRLVDVDAGGRNRNSKAALTPVSLFGPKILEKSKGPFEPFASYSGPDRPDLTEVYIRQITKIAEDALAYYNKKHLTNYELVEPLVRKVCFESDGRSEEGRWEHCNFKAKPKAAVDGGNNGDSSTKLFFAERQYIRRTDRYVVTACRILDGVKTKGDCAICPARGAPLLHPTSGFRKGCYYRNYQRVLRSRTRAMPGYCRG